MAEMYHSLETLDYMRQVQALVAASSTAGRSIEELRSPQVIAQRREALMGASALAGDIEWHPLMNLLPQVLTEVPPMFPTAQEATRTQ